MTRGVRPSAHEVACVAVEKINKRLAREQERLQKVDGQLAAVTRMWTVALQDVLEAERQHLLLGTQDTRRQLALATNQERTAHWKMTERQRMKQEIEAAIAALQADLAQTQSRSDALSRQDDDTSSAA